jgi:hypothetical protein
VLWLLYRLLLCLDCLLLRHFCCVVTLYIKTPAVSVDWCRLAECVWEGHKAGRGAKWDSALPDPILVARAGACLMADGDSLAGRLPVAIVWNSISRHYGSCVYYSLLL